MDLGLRDKLILITGGASGIGAAITQACLDEGAFVVAVGRRMAEVVHFEQRMHAEPRFSFLAAELADPEACRQAIAYTRERHGSLFGLVNNAGTNDSVGLQDGDPQCFLESLMSNLLHYYAMAHYPLPLLQASQGATVKISSKVALTGEGNTSAYAAAKRGAACPYARVGRRTCKYRNLRKQCFPHADVRRVARPPV